MAELWTFTRLDSIAAGCLLAVVAQEATWRTRLDRWAALWPVVLMVLGLSLTLSRFSGKWGVGVAYSLNAACLFGIVWAAARRAPRWLNSSVMSAVGVGSYSLSLWQQLFLNPHRAGWATEFPRNLILAAVTAWVSFRCIESPFLRLKDRGRHSPASGPAVDRGAAARERDDRNEARVLAARIDDRGPEKQGWPMIPDKESASGSRPLDETP